MFCIGGRQTAYNYLSRKAHEMADECIQRSDQKALSNHDVTNITTFINEERLVPKKVFIYLDAITSLFFITLAILSFTGVLPNITLGGSIAMITIGCLNLILTSICYPPQLKLSPAVKQKFKKTNFIHDAIEIRLKKY